MVPDAVRPPRNDAYAVAFTDWLACACAGADQRAARAVRASGEDLLTDVAFAATAGHVLDFDDTFSDGIAHVSAACAPAALVLAARLELTLEAALDAYAAGFESMAALAAASHPALYDAGWHPTAVCGPVGAAVAAARLLGLPDAQRSNAIAVALLRAGGTRGAFGSDGKAIQVGLAAAAGVQGALLAREGASVDPRAIHGPLGFEQVLGAAWPPTGVDGASPQTAYPSERDSREAHGAAIERNWIKLYPSCLGTHSPIEAAALLPSDARRLDGDRLDVAVHPVARQAAHLDLVDDGLSGKFSIPYCVAYTVEHGIPGVRDFAALDHRARERSEHVNVIVDPTLPEWGTVLARGGVELARLPGPRGTPERPVGQAELSVKVRDLAGERLDGLLDDLGAPAARALEAAGLRSGLLTSSDATIPLRNAQGAMSDT